jgi:hypothetical protein
VEDSRGSHIKIVDGSPGAVILDVLRLDELLPSMTLEQVRAFDAWLVASPQQQLIEIRVALRLRAAELEQIEGALG